ncbi:unnamed protein product, partial [Staurois parvus]
METHSMTFSTLCCANLKATRSLDVFRYSLCRQLMTSVHCAFQHALTPLYHFTWPTTSRLSCCCSQLSSTFVIIPLTVDRGIFSIKEISRMDLLPLLSQMFVEAVC